MYCPKCKHIMGAIKHGAITVDRCTYCKGIWFDHLEMDQLQRLKGAAVIDSGCERTGQSYDTLKKISCPHCKIAMTVAQAPDKEHFSYEICPQCQGVFLDAGEFKEFHNKKTILGFLKKLF